MMAFPFPPAGLPFSPLALLPTAINHLLAQEPWARDTLRLHSGKTAEFVMAPFELRLKATADGLVELCRESAQADVRIELPLAELPRALAEALTPGAAPVTRQIKIEGDADFAQAVSFLVQNLRWEPEEDMSKWVGDAAAHGIAKRARGAAEQLRTAHEKLAGNVAEYLLEENPQLVRPRKVDALSESLRVLRDDLARLEKRIDRLTGKIA
jgi:ubiquinone biosynthesis protein UbiJ